MTDDEIPFDDDEAADTPSLPVHLDCNRKQYEVGMQLRNIHDHAIAVVTDVSDPLDVWVLYDDSDKPTRLTGRHGEILDRPKRIVVVTTIDPHADAQDEEDFRAAQMDDAFSAETDDAIADMFEGSDDLFASENTDDDPDVPIQEERVQAVASDDGPVESESVAATVSSGEVAVCDDTLLAPPPGDPKPWRIHHGDGPSGLLSLPEVDVLISDVPFSKKVDDGNERDTTRDNSFHFDPMTEELRERMAQAIGARVRRWAIIMTSDDECELWKAAMARAGMIFYRTGHWIRGGTKPQMNGMGPAQGAEYLLIFHSRFGAMRWNGGGKPAIWHAHIVQGDERRHETQKPTKLLRELIEDFTDPGELVADICAGSFQLAIVAVSMGRRFVGWDIRKQDVDVARELLKTPLLNNEPMQASLFAEPRAATRTKQARAMLDHEVQRAVQAKPGIKLAELLMQLGNPEDHEVRGSLKRLAKAFLVRKIGRTSNSAYYPMTLADREALDAEQRAKLAASETQVQQPQEASP